MNINKLINLLFILSMNGTKVDNLITEIPPEASVIHYDKVKFPRSWAFWENYSAKALKLDYQKAMKLIFSWDDLISFWQFWNHYPGSDASKIFFNGEHVKFFFKEQYRITAMNIFVKGIKPAWEDSQNKGGKYLQLEYKIERDLDKFFSVVSDSWLKLILNSMGENAPGAEYINGLRFIDKTQFERGKYIMFRFEIWINKTIKKEILTQLVEYLKKEMGCGTIDIKNID